ncbi:scarecrow-like protein 8-like [Dorcoceras hygrometricum]|uniref:Scarecrow-like protein 8-like n=1 Tax=Dorcoceras hygrometricum TaxID=472368 RepID=A0A2Z7C294_9LAMI|nr:scarecrow-like protein 8-like [Dorcoceras hygrometricum]
MSSGFSGGVPDFFTAGRRTTNMPLSMDSNNLNSQQQNILQQQGLGFYLRNVKPRPNYQHASPVSTLSPVDFPPVTTLSPDVSSMSSSLVNNTNPRYGFPILHQQRLQPLILSNTTNVNNVTSGIPLPKLVLNQASVILGPGHDLSAQECEKNILNHKLQELEKQLLGDEDEGEAASVITSNGWSETIQNLINPEQKPISPSPTSSSSSSCSSTSASPPLPCSRQSLIDLALAISEGKPEIAADILTRLQHVASSKGNSEQRLAAHVLSSLKSRVNPVVNPPPVAELYSKEQSVAAQMLYEFSSCFKLGFMAANLAILEATSEHGFTKIHVVDLDIGQGGQYMHLLHALAAKKSEGKPTSMLKITTLTDSAAAARGCSSEEKVRTVGEELKSLASKLDVSLAICVKNVNITELSRENLDIKPDEALAVNFAFQLYKLPDESVTTENPRDEMLRRVKGLSPTVTTIVEQEMNANTAPLVARVREVCEHYGALLDSLDATVPKDNSNRVRIEEGLSRKIKNSVACEGRDRVERCEVFGKWRARVGMAGFKIRPMSQLAADSLRSKLHSGTRVNPGFTVNEQSGGICFGWMGRTLTVASAWS